MSAHDLPTPDPDADADAEGVADAAHQPGEPLDWIALSGTKPRGRRPFFFDDPAVERVLAVTMAVAQEVAVLRERVDTLERLLERGGTFTRDAIDAYEPDPAAAGERAEWNRAYIARVLRIVQQQLEALDAPDDDYELAAKSDELGGAESDACDRSPSP